MEQPAGWRSTASLAQDSFPRKTAITVNQTVKQAFTWGILGLGKARFCHRCLVSHSVNSPLSPVKKDGIQDQERQQF